MAKLKEPLPVEDPAYRDVDRQSWVPGRFEERIRRTWNQVRTAEIHAAGGDLDRLTDVVHGKVGGDRRHIRDRLEAFQCVENTLHRQPREDPLVRPGAPA